MTQNQVKEIIYSLQRYYPRAYEQVLSEAALFPLVMRKAFGCSVGMIALVLALAAIGTLLALPLQGAFPVMVVLGPLMMLQ